MPDWKRPAMVGYFMIFLAFRSFGRLVGVRAARQRGGGAGYSDAGISKKIIQHFEGGIIAKILVHEGEHVEQGQILFLLDNTAPQANANAVRNQLDAYLAQEARLVAERNGAEQVTYPPDLMDDTSRSPSSRMQSEMKTSNLLSAALRWKARSPFSKSKIKQFETQIDGISDEKTPQNSNWVSLIPN